jgi:predicted amidohydrolase
LSPFNLTEATLIANAESCPFAFHTETATHWRTRGCARSVIENAAALSAAAHAARMMVESELGA